MYFCILYTLIQTSKVETN